MAKRLSPVSLANVVLIRTVTHYHIGRIVDIGSQFIILEDAAWVADTGRFHDALTSGTVSEAEPFVGDVAVAIGSIIDVTLWTGAIPMKQK